jgi:hypothetical protein
MILRMRWPFFVMALALFLLIGVVAVACYTGFFCLRKVSIAPEQYTDQTESLDPFMGKNIFLTPADDALAYLAYNQMVKNIQLSYNLPDEIIIEVEEVKPLALAMGQDGHSIYALDERGRAIPHDQPGGGYNLPIITGLKDCPLYKSPSDSRLRLIIPQLASLRADHEDFYRAISSIDLSSPDSVTVFIDGVHFSLIMYAGKMYENFGRLKKFLLDYSPDLKDVVSLDMRSGNQIIAARKKCLKQG